jgi:hypothetical protein
VSAASEQSKSRERASATLFSRPGNHWEYSLMLASRRRMAWWQAVSIRTLAWTGSGSLPVSSWKLVLRSHPADVVLLVIERAQSRLRRTPMPRMVEQHLAADKALVALALLHVIGPIGKFGQRLRRTPAPRMVKGRRAADRFLVAFASKVFGG